MGIRNFESVSCFVLPLRSLLFLSYSLFSSLPVPLLFPCSFLLLLLLIVIEGIIAYPLSGIRRRPVLPGRCQPSTFGAKRLNFCVRYGYRWFPLAIVTGISRCVFHTFKTAQRKVDLENFLHSIFQSFDLSLIRPEPSSRPISIGKLHHCWPYTADLSPHRL